MIAPRDPISVRGQTIRGSGDRSMCIEQAAHHRHMAKVLSEQLVKWAPHLPLTAEQERYVREDTKRRVAEHVAAAQEYLDAVKQYDDTSDPNRIYDIPEQLRGVMK